MQTPRPALIQEQRQKLSPQLLQGLQILALPLQDLAQRIAEEIEANPALEVMEEKYYESLDTSAEGGDTWGDPSMPELGAYDSYEYGTYDQDDSKDRFIQGALSRPESLQDHLLWQLRLTPMPDEFFQIGEILVRNLDEHGFHLEDPKTIIPEDRYGPMAEVQKIIQSLEPAGCCTTDFKDSLMVQAKQYADMPPIVPRILGEFWEHLEKGRTRDIEKASGASTADIEEAITFIKQLNPYPGQAYSRSETSYVIPDVHITNREGEFIITINDEVIPVLGVNPFFDEMLKKKEKDEREVRQFAQSKLRDARWFINSIRIRNETLLKVVRALVEFQREFFLHGPKKVVPLTLRNVADEIGVHEATVSRLTAGKYAQTDWGLFELKYFFSGTIVGTAGQQFTREGVKMILKEILAEHSGQTLSDQKITDLLADKGVKIARRTVAKYRGELDIASSYER